MLALKPFACSQEIANVAKPRNCTATGTSTSPRPCMLQGLWTHGGSIEGEFGSFQADDGTSFESDIFHEVKCPRPTCARGNPTDIHIYHFRSPSLEDDIKKAEDWHWKEHPEEGLQISDDDYDAGTWFYNLVRDVSLLQFSDALSARILPLLSPSVNASHTP